MNPRRLRSGVDYIIKSGQVIHTVEGRELKSLHGRNLYTFSDDYHIIGMEHNLIHIRNEEGVRYIVTVIDRLIRIRVTDRLDLL